MKTKILLGAAFVALAASAPAVLQAQQLPAPVIAVVNTDQIFTTCTQCAAANTQLQAQAAGVLAVESLGLAHSGKLVYFMSIENAKFRTPVEPGVLLRLECVLIQRRGPVWKFGGKAYVGDRLATQADFTAMIADPPATPD